MKIKKGFIKTKVIDGWVVVPVGEESKSRKIMLTLNGTASEIWDMLIEGKNRDEIVSSLRERYGIPAEQAEKGVDRVIDTLAKEGILEE